MEEIKRQWNDGYIDGWNSQGISSKTYPPIPPLPSIPSNVSDKNNWAYEEGKKRGKISRMKSQAGIQ